jgi:hypothetical protein
MAHDLPACRPAGGAGELAAHEAFEEAGIRVIAHEPGICLAFRHDSEPGNWG